MCVGGGVLRGVVLKAKPLGADTFAVAKALMELALQSVCAAAPGHCHCPPSRRRIRFEGKDGKVFLKFVFITGEN